MKQNRKFLNSYEPPFRMIVVIGCASFIAIMSEEQLKIDQDNRKCSFDNKEITQLDIQIQQGNLSANITTLYVVQDFNYHIIIPDTDQFIAILKNSKIKTSDFILTTTIGDEEIKSQFKQSKESNAYISKIVSIATASLVGCFILLVIIIGIMKEKMGANNIGNYIQIE